MQLPWGGIAWSQEWVDGRPATVNREALLAGSSSIYHSLRAGVALAELVDDPQPEWELAGGRLGPRAARAPRPVPRQVDVLDGLVLPGPRRRRPRLRRPAAARGPLGRVRRARPRHQVRRHQPVGDRRRDLRAGDGARRPRRPRPGAAAVRRHAAPARHRRPLLDRLRLPRRRQLAGRAHDLHRRRGDPRRRRARPRHAGGSDIMRGATLPRRLRGVRPRVRLPVSRRASPASPAVRR